MAVVQIVGQPWVRGGELLHGVHERGGEVHAQRGGEQLQRHRARAHHLRGLLVEKLQLCDGSQHFGGANEDVLRHLPEDGELRGGGAGAVDEEAGNSDVAPPHLHPRSGQHGQGRHQQAPPHLLELSQLDAVGGQQRIEALLKHGNEDDDGDGVKGAERRRRDVDPASYVPVHLDPLLHEDGGHLLVHGPVHDRGEEHGHHLEHQSHLVDLSAGEAAAQRRAIQPIGELQGGLPWGLGRLRGGQGGEAHGGETCQRAGLWLSHPVLVAASPEEHDGEQERGGGDGEADDPAHVFLDVHNDERGDERADVDGEVEPVEEGSLLLSVLRVGLVKLLRPESTYVGLDAARSQRHEVEC
mmetsp:Transcript_12865/g.24449  ORF Transcript_12865/g.24449 Transcript_12865/m.24449 type:complete len:355 (+) Transcript_12865:558-1622(+)